MNKYKPGERFGRLVLVSVVSISNSGNKVWSCICDCGNITRVSTNHIGDGHTISCGCFQQERRFKHKKSKTRLHRIWLLMNFRCRDAGKESQKYYGSRGIRVCDDWMYDFNLFYKWAVLHGYLECLTIDRIDNNKGYFPDNCRWVKREDQSRNIRRNIYLTNNNETRLLCDWARYYGLTYNTVYGRYKQGKTFMEIFS